MNRWRSETLTTPHVIPEIPATRIRRRSTRSAIAPEMRTRRTIGTIPAMLIAATSSGSEVRRTAVTAIAIRTTPSARFEDPADQKSRRKSEGRLSSPSARWTGATDAIR